jgi:two-component system, OmpR family, sensor histidine kinase ChvG
MLSFPKSRISRRLDILGALRQAIPADYVKRAKRIASSLTVKLVILLGVFLALPFVLYGQIAGADHRLAELVSRGIQHQSWLIVQALRPVLDQSRAMPDPTLSAELAKYAGDGTELKLMLRPLGGPARRGFYFVASAPKVAPDQLDRVLDNLDRNGILAQLSQTCSWNKSVEIRYRDSNGKQEILTSVIPIQNRWGCWALVSSHTTTEFLSTSIGRPYWRTPEIRAAAFIYLAVGVTAILIVWSLWQNIKHFRRVASDARKGRSNASSFASRDVVPELSTVAADFDHLVRDLHKAARDIRQAAEDNAHSFKAPVATITAALAPLRQACSAENGRAARAVALVSSSLERLNALIAASQRLDNVTADLIEAPRSRINLSRMIEDILLGYREIMAARGIYLTQRLDESIHVNANAEAIAVVVENVLDNAVSFSPPSGLISVSLVKNFRSVELCIEDEGPGIDPKKIDRIFDRYFSLRPHADGERQADGTGEQTGLNHAGLGLWIVRRNVESLGGIVTAANRLGRGLCVRVVLPAERGRFSRHDVNALKESS